MDEPRSFTAGKAYDLIGINKNTAAGWQKYLDEPGEKAHGAHRRLDLLDMTVLSSMQEMTTFGLPLRLAAPIARGFRPAFEALIAHGLGHPKMAQQWMMVYRRADGAVLAEPYTGEARLDAVSVYLVNLGPIARRVCQRVIAYDDAMKGRSTPPALCDDCVEKRRPSDEFFWCEHHRVGSKAEYTESGALRGWTTFSGASEAEFNEARRLYDQKRRTRH